MQTRRSEVFVSIHGWENLGEWGNWKSVGEKWDFSCRVKFVLSRQLFWLGRRTAVYEHSLWVCGGEVSPVSRIFVPKNFPGKLGNLLHLGKWRATLSKVSNYIEITSHTVWMVICREMLPLLTTDSVSSKCQSWLYSGGNILHFVLLSAPVYDVLQRYILRFGAHVCFFACACLSSNQIVHDLLRQWNFFVGTVS